MTERIGAAAPCNAGAAAERGAEQELIVTLDVRLAFTTAAYALAAGAREIFLVRTVEEAGRIAIVYGRDAADYVALITEFGDLETKSLHVRVEKH